MHRRRLVMTQRDPGARRQHRREAVTLAPQRTMPDGVDATMERKQTFARQTRANHRMRHAGSEELSPGDHAVLARRQRRDHPVGTSRVNWMLLGDI